MSKGLEAFKVVCDDYHTLVVRYYYASNIDKIERNKMYYNNKEEMAIVEKELKAGEIAIGFIDNIANEFDEHDLDELTDKVVKTKKALEIIKELFEFDFALRFPNNQPMIMITNKYGGSYFEIPISKEKYDALKEVLDL